MSTAKEHIRSAAHAQGWSNDASTTYQDVFDRPSASVRVSYTPDGRISRTSLLSPSGHSIALFHKDKYKYEQTMQWLAAHD